MNAATARSKKRDAPSSLLEASERPAGETWPRGISREPVMKIGQVVDLLKVEFPALSISKVRYLEGEGLISPHRVGNGYRRYSQADLERLRYALAVQRDEYLPLHVIRDRLARLDADVEAPAPQPVARVVARDGQIVDNGPMDLEALLVHSGASESQIEELVAVGLISPDVRGRYSQQNLRTVRLAMEITRKGVPLRNLRAVRASAERRRTRSTRRWLHAGRGRVVPARRRPGSWPSSLRTCTPFCCVAPLTHWAEGERTRARSAVVRPGCLYRQRSACIVCVFPGQG